MFFHFCAHPLLSCPLLAVHNFLDAFYLSRIGIRMLIGQYLELREPPKPDHIGLVCLVGGAGGGGGSLLLAPDM